jgi:hypothetical protein
VELGFLLHPSHSKVPIIYSERRLDYKIATDPVQGVAVLIGVIRVMMVLSLWRRVGCCLVGRRLLRRCVL